jgi:MFS family permease
MSTTNPQSAVGSRYFGSLVIFASFVGMVFGPASVLVYSFGVFVGPIEQTFGWTRAQISIAATIIVFVSVITQPIQGFLVDRYGVRRVSLISVPIFCASIAGLYFIPANIAVFYGAWVIVTLCGMALWNGSYNKVMAAWYDRKLGMAVGIIGAGQGVGGALVPLICQTLVTHVGWRGAYVGLALITLVMTFSCNYLFLYNEPADKGLLPDGEGVAGRAEKVLPDGLTFKEALEKRPFWIMAVSFFLLGTMTTTIVAHLIPMLVDSGITPQTAVLSMSAFGIAVILGRICAGLSLDHFYAPWVLIAFMIGPIIGLVMFALGHPGSAAFVWAALIGLGVGAEIDVLGYLIPRYCGRLAYAKIYGSLLAAFQLGGGIGTAALGIIRTSQGSYTNGLWAITVTTVLSVIVISQIGPYRYQVLAHAGRLGVAKA